MYPVHSVTFTHALMTCQCLSAILTWVEAQSSVSRALQKRRFESFPRFVQEGRPPLPTPSPHDISLPKYAPSPCTSPIFLKSWICPCAYKSSVVFVIKLIHYGNIGPIENNPP